jgi:hypothetical protein
MDFAADIDGVFFSDFAQEVSYERNGTTYTVKAIMGDEKIDEDGAVVVDAVTTVYVAESQLKELGLNEPKPHDVIDGKWEVENRIYSAGIYTLGCYAKTRLKP